MEAILFIAILFGLSWLYYTVKEKAKRNLLFKNQYETQKALTHGNMLITTTAAIDDVRASLDRYLAPDDSVRAVFIGGAIKLVSRDETTSVYKHISKITTGGGGDEFTASVTFLPPADSAQRAIVSIDCWREKDGVTRRAGIQAMQKFMSAVVSAFKEVDPSAYAEFRAAA